jgi:hypothetical protein
MSAAEASWLRDMLAASTGRKFPVKPVILIPDWFVEPVKGTKDVWALNPQVLPKFIERENVCVREDDLHLAAYHLTRYIQSPVKK